MTTWTVGQLLDATGGELVTGNRADSVRGFSIDSRRIQPQEAFLAIQGPRFDGHEFVPQAIERGASCVILSTRPTTALPVPTIVVAETIRALGAIAASHRRRFQIPVIAVTGSCGKTTTKELIAHLLSHDCQPRHAAPLAGRGHSGRGGSDPDRRSGERRKGNPEGSPPRVDYHLLKTTGTQNNHIGLPLTLLGLSDSHDCAVVELGSNHPGEIAYLANIARPTVAVITNVGPAHLEFFGSLDVVRQEKLSLLDALDPMGSAILPGDQLEVLLEAKTHLRPSTALLTFGTSDQCGVQAVEIRRTGFGMSIRLRGVAGEFVVPLLGPHNAENMLAALACVKALRGSLDAARDRLQGFTPLPMRSELVRCNGLTVVNDCYNANPLSFARALEILKDLDVTRKVVIAGDMLELGDSAQAAHQAIGRLAADLGVQLVVAVGTFAEEVAKGACAHPQTSTLTFRTVQELLQQLPAIVRDGDGLLIKGSRKLNLEHVTAFLLEHYHGKPTATSEVTDHGDDDHIDCPTV